MLNENKENIIEGVKVEYIGCYDDDNDLYEQMEENGSVYEVSAIDEDGGLVWLVGCSYAIPIDLVTLWLYD